jgi:hypothetical protein
MLVSGYGSPKFRNPQPGRILITPAFPKGHNRSLNYFGRPVIVGKPWP